MMAKCAIVNSSPLIFLSKAGYLDLLKLAADEVFVPDAVILEINRRGADDVTVLALQQASWLQVVEVKPQSLEQAPYSANAPYGLLAMKCTLKIANESPKKIRC
ncbi:MAG: hypothetical protein NTV43_04495 [Methylococcales bacterium]|nr:hypothetical protein [Methylococcales bacterium]